MKSTTQGQAPWVVDFLLEVDFIGYSSNPPVTYKYGITLPYYHNEMAFVKTLVTHKIAFPFPNSCTKKAMREGTLLHTHTFYKKLRYIQKVYTFVKMEFYENAILEIR